MKAIPIRKQLTAWYFLIVATALIGFAFFALAVMRQSIYSTVDEQLEDRARALQSLIANSDAAGVADELKKRGELQSGSQLFQVDIALQVAGRDSTVILTGESGTGKELLAKAIHQNSMRASKPFVTVNCGAIPENLIESELFGYRKGAFTGALVDRIGKFEAANEGTVFLDEIGELPPALQVRLLRVIQEREIDKIGQPHPIKINVRIIAATNRKLQNLIEDGQFREDLFYRLSVVTIDLPPLRERRDDIPLLIQHFLKKHCDRYQMPMPNLSDEAVDLLTQYNWPGNVRELENVIENVIVLSRSNQISAEDLPVQVRQTS